MKIHSTGIGFCQWQNLRTIAQSSCPRSHSPPEIVTEYQPRKPIDLVPLPLQSRPDESTQSFAQHIHDLDAEIRWKIALSNENYKTVADVHRRYQEFFEGDIVMVRVRPKRFPAGMLKKPHAGKAGQYPIQRRINTNAYELQHLDDMNQSHV